MLAYYGFPFSKNKDVNELTFDIVEELPKSNRSVPKKTLKNNSKSLDKSTPKKPIKKNISKKIQTSPKPKPNISEKVMKKKDF